MLVRFHKENTKWKLCIVVEICLHWFKQYFIQQFTNSTKILYEGILLHRMVLCKIRTYVKKYLVNENTNNYFLFYMRVCTSGEWGLDCENIINFGHFHSKRAVSAINV